MLNIGVGEMTLILIAALVVMGPDRLPEFARTLGKFLREFRRQTDDVRGVVMREIYKLEQEVDLEGEKPKRNLLAPPAPAVSTLAPPASVEPSLLSPSVTVPTPANVAPAEVSSPPSSPESAAPESPAPAVAASEGAAAVAGNPLPAPEPELLGTVVDGIRIAPAAGAVARGARPASVASASSPVPASDAPPSPTPQS